MILSFKNYPNRKTSIRLVLYILSLQLVSFESFVWWTNQDWSCYSVIIFSSIRLGHKISELNDSGMTCLIQFVNLIKSYFVCWNRLTRTIRSLIQSLSSTHRLTDLVSAVLEFWTLIAGCIRLLLLSFSKLDHPSHYEPI